jgi:hypothetical protein
MSEVLALLMKHGEDMGWFLDNYDRLVKEYDGNFVAVYEHAVVDCDEDLDRLIERISGRYPLERLIIEYVSKEKPLLVL